jgi:hypothetical protein
MSKERIKQLRNEIAEEKWWQKHYIERKVELRNKKAPEWMLKQYDKDLELSIKRVDVKMMELKDLEEFG